MTPAATPLRIVDLPVHALTQAAFAPFGQVIAPAEDGTDFSTDEAQLEFGGRPRFYILSLAHKPLGFRSITRHIHVTQCLGAVGGVDWLVAVAPPGSLEDNAAEPDPASITAFAIPGTLGIKLHRGTWHAGPYFTAPKADFYNLELADTNQVDHQNVHLDQRFGMEFRFAT